MFMFDKLRILIFLGWEQALKAQVHITDDDCATYYLTYVY